MWGLSQTATTGWASCYTGATPPDVKGDMPTSKKRINISVDDAIYKALERLSIRRGESVAGTGLKLIEQALEFQEDLYFSRVADQRIKQNQKRISHHKAWE